MKSLFALALLAGLAGCALSPAEIKERGTRNDFHLKLPPGAAAACVARNAENMSNQSTHAIRAVTRQGVADGEIDMVVSGGELYIFTATFVAEGKGTHATAWESPRTFKFGGRGFMATFDGC